MHFIHALQNKNCFHWTIMSTLKKRKTGFHCTRKSKKTELLLRFETPEFKAIHDAGLSGNDKVSIIKRLENSIEEYAGCIYFTLSVTSVPEEYMKRQFYVDGASYSYNDYNRFFH